MEETFAYLKDVLGIKYLPLSHATVTDGESALFIADDPELLALHTSGLDSDFPVGRAASMDLSEPEESVEESSAINVEAVSATHALENLSELRRQADDLIENNEMDSAPVADVTRGSPLNHQLPVISDNRVTTAATPAPELDALQRAFDQGEYGELHRDLHHIIYGTGSPKAQIMFIGASPGDAESLAKKSSRSSQKSSQKPDDVAGDPNQRRQPFVGATGVLLEKMILAMGLKIEDIYLANVIQCHPSSRLPAAPAAVAGADHHECPPFLLGQIRLINPKVIVALGARAAQALLQTDSCLGVLRGHVQLMSGGRKVIVTHHPADLLKNPDDKKAAWQDLKLALHELKGMA